MKKKILVIDDDEGIVTAISIILDTYGYSIDATTKGEEVGMRVSDFQPDLILLDVFLAGYDGRDICKKLKADNATKRIPIIMISAHPSAKAHSRLSGADDFLPKPFEIDQLISLITKNLV